MAKHKVLVAKYEVLQNLNYNGVDYAIGGLVELDDKQVIKYLLESGVIKEAQEVLGEIFEAGKDL
ncbi:MAG: hypothetical protein DDT42_00446 [candidate division WS2 bacterium]|uniref:Uncharacterized protein n=1 Tax=Psychracetigena formicireducens TaxID=2986056 RepID=A0A9E2BGI9_PSYF1|nr:hypothetical protein [Candidatus Psychracetigena formicireducens]